MEETTKISAREQEGSLAGTGQLRIEERDRRSMGKMKFRTCRSVDCCCHAYVNRSSYKMNLRLRFFHFIQIC